MVKVVKYNEYKDEKNYKHVIIPGFTFYDKDYNGTFSPDDILNGDTYLNIKILVVSLILLFL